MSDDTQADAAEYVLGLLEPRERRSVAQRMESDPAFRRAVEEWSMRLAPVSDTVPLMRPPAGVWQAIAARIAPEPIVARRKNQGIWLDMGRGVTMKMLHVDPDSGVRSALLRMAPGSRVEEHDHVETEQCYVVDGSIVIDGERYDAGDNVVAAADTKHLEITAPNGAVMLLHWGATPAFA